MHSITFMQMRPALSLKSLLAAFWLALTLFPGPSGAAEVPCGGAFDAFLKGLEREAVAAGLPKAKVAAFLSGARLDPRVLRADRAQGHFQRPFVDFSRRLIAPYRLERGRKLAVQKDAILSRAEREYGVSRGILLAFWAFETDFGAVQGDFNTRDALVTLAHDCRRPEIFRPQVLAAIALYARGDFDPERTTGAWAGEVGMVQLLPRDILERGVDGDGDGHVRLKTSEADALLTAANVLRALGWRHGEPWLQEVVVPARMDWSLAGLQNRKAPKEWGRLGVRPRSGRWLAPNLKAALLLPQGRKGPAFVAYPNFDVLFEWNQSFVYVLTAAYFATRLEGAPPYDAGNPDPGLSGQQMKRLQRKLAAMGYDVGEIDGILGLKTRAAVRDVQKRLGMPADAWPTPELLSRL